MTVEEVPVAVIGSGPAAHTAALYLGRAHLTPLVFAGFQSGPVGGQLMMTTEVENFPGFPEGITGPELMVKFRLQSEKFGARVLEEDVISIQEEDKKFLIRTDKQSFLAKGVIIATGATAKKLDVPGVDQFWQKGISACAICDGALPLFRNQAIAVIGGGDSAMEEALFLTRFARRVHVIHRRESFRASPIMAKRVLEHPKIEVIWNSVLKKVEGAGNLETVHLEDVKSGTVSPLPVKGLFFAIGHRPNTSFLGDLIDLDHVGYISVTPGTSRTSREGIFAAGDVVDPHYRQAITAAGSGCIAALDCERWLAPRFP
ncbi:thioredoxin-disulfide reductase [Candidatus Similichlamydia laticola]|uniref:Thioredoxin reductase n=1 Tax=Candidatus Similichlamydia laticola TaxID=2170265 RepID=A0A369KC89_9BACT|nr:thioredoxin-disulfide reductase [Candidatus Similichlamydia laticola]RDB31528.1 Thioredoxin reductase [Candidatus Similichlamydia laticola]